MADDGYIKIKTKIEGLAESLKGIKDLGLGVFGLGTIYKTLTGTVKQLYAALDDLNKAYKEQKNAEVQLATAVRNNPYLDSSSVKKLEKYASSLQAISTVGDEKLLPFMAQLAASGRTESQIMQIMSAALDASASGMVSLDEAVRGLNNSYTGQIGRLGMAIPALKSLTDEELRAGKAVNVVADTYRGLAEKTSSATGSSEKLKNAFGDLKEELGYAVERGLRPWNEKLAELTTKTADALKETRKLKDALDALNGGTAGTNDYEALLKANQQYIDEYLRSVRETREALDAGYMTQERYAQIMDNLNQQYDIYLKNQSKWTMAKAEAEAREREANAQTMAAKAQAEAAKEIETSEQKRAKYIADNEAARDRAVNTLRMEADLRGEAVDEEALLDAYVKSYVSLLGDVPGLVKAEDKEATSLRKTLEGQLEVVKAKAQADEEAEKAAKAAEEAAKKAEEEARKAAAEERKRPEYIAQNTAERQKALEAMKIAAQLRGEQIDDEAVLDEYVKSYISLLTEAPGLVRADDEEAQKLLATIKEQVEALKAKQEAEESAKKATENEKRDAATLAEIRAAEQKAAEASLSRFIGQLNGISSPDGRTPQEQIADQRRRLEEFYGDIMAMETVSEEQKLALEEQFTQKRITLIQMEREAVAAALDEEREKRKQLAKESLSSLVSTVNTMAALAKENSEANLDVKIAEIEAEELSEEEKNKKILEARKKAAREQYRIELWQWTVSSLQAAANIAEGISKCFAQSGPYGFITSALVAAAGAAQIATIIASKPQPPAFATGGVVPGNSYTGDRVSALVNSGEMILTRQQQARLFDMANGIGGGETNINIKNYRGSDTEVTANVTGHDIELIIDKRVNESMAAGRYNKSYGIMQNNYNGTRYTN